MTKTFTCRELGGTCDQSFTGESVEDILRQAGSHMMADEEHAAAIMALAERTGESKEAWTERMKKEFDARQADA